MKSEVLIAIFVGLSMGLIITFGIYRVKNSVSQPPTTDLTITETTAPTTAEPTLLAVLSPEDGTIQTGTELTVTGTTTPNSFVVVFVNDSDSISTSDESGNFTDKVTLVSGENIIRVHVLDETGTSVVVERLVVVSDAFEKLQALQEELEQQQATASAEEPSSALAQIPKQTTKTVETAEKELETDADATTAETITTATDSSTLENIKQIIKKNIQNSRVQGVIDDISKNRTALLGEVTRVTDETITISSRLGNRIIPIDQTISITKDGKEIKITDVAVENWVTILGRTQNDTFTPIFMFVHAKSIQPKNQYVSIGTVTGVTKNSLTLQPRSQAEEKTITITSKTLIEQPDGEELELSDISEDIAVLITGYETETTTEAVTIRLLAQTDQDE